MPAAPRAALDVGDLVDRIPGITGVVVRTLGDGPPVVAIRADEKFAAASVIKLAIMATVYRAYDAGTAKPSDTVKTRASDLIGGSDVLAGSPAGKEWSLDTLVKAMIRVSDNSASNTLITAFGMGTVNATMQLGGHDELAARPPFRRRRAVVAAQRERHHARRHRAAAVRDRARCARRDRDDRDAAELPRDDRRAARQRRRHEDRARPAAGHAVRAQDRRDRLRAQRRGRSSTRSATRPTCSSCSRASCATTPPATPASARSRTASTPRCAAARSAG